MFIAARVQERGADKRTFVIKAGDTLFRYQFMEFLIRIAIARFQKTEEASTPAQALQMLFKVLEPISERCIKEQEDFLKAFHIEACDLVLKRFEQKLRSFYRSHTGRMSKP